MKRQPSVFMSYARQDSAFAERLSDALVNVGHAVFADYDVAGEGARGGSAEGIGPRRRLGRASAGCRREGGCVRILDDALLVAKRLCDVGDRRRAVGREAGHFRGSDRGQGYHTICRRRCARASGYEPAIGPLRRSQQKSLSALDQNQSRISA